MDMTKQKELDKLLTLLTESNTFLREQNVNLNAEVSRITKQLNFLYDESEQRWEVCLEIFKKEGYKISYKKEGKLDG